MISTARSMIFSWQRMAVTLGVSAAVCFSRMTWMVSAWSTSSLPLQSRTIQTSTTAMDMARLRGLERNREGATPTEGGMTLYLKAAEDGTSVGDCPFAHFVRMVLEEKGLEYEVKPTTKETKPTWLVEFYEGKLPALRHRKECYVESGVIGDYLEFFFQEPSLKVTSPEAEEVLEGFFPAVAQYLKTMEGEDTEKLDNLKAKLQVLEDHLADGNKAFLDGDSFSMVDCRLTPQLYHLQTGIEGFKSGKPSLSEDFPKVFAYMDRCQGRPSFQASSYPKETILWGWGNARN